MKISRRKVVFDFNDAGSKLKGKQIKAQTLTAMLEYITMQRNIFTESIYLEVVNTVRFFTILFLFPRVLIRETTPHPSSQLTSSVRHPHNRTRAGMHLI